ncbi:hypothetical protein Tco_0393833 [Tanacetum coccineum]
MVEEPVKIKKKDQIGLDEELAFKLQAEEEEEMLAREKAQREEEANIVTWDNVQAMIDADYQMAQQMQAEEQEKLSIEEKSKLFVQLLEARKKHFAATKNQEKRNKPPTKAQKRKTMSTYLKNMARYKHMDTELVEGSEVRVVSRKIRVEGSSKRAGEELEQESSKNQKLEEDKEIAELQSLIEVVPNKEEVAINAIPLATKPPSIVDYMIYKKGKKTYYQIIKADGSSKMYLVFSHILKSFDKEDLETLWKLVKMDDPNITMEEYIRLEEEKSRRRGKVYNWETATYGKIWDNEDVHDLRYVKTKFPAIVFNDTLTFKATLLYEPTVSSLNNDEIEFRISFDESDDEDCTPTVSCFDDLDFFNDLENEFPAIVYNDAQTSKLDFSTKPVLNPQHIDEFDLKSETSLSKCDEEEQNVLNFNDLFPFNVIYLDELKTDTYNDNDKVDIEHSSVDLSVKPLPDVINTDVRAYAHGSNKLLETSHDTSNKFFKTGIFIKELNFNIMTWNYLNKGMSFIFLIKNLYVYDNEMNEMIEINEMYEMIN